MIIESLNLRVGKLFIRIIPTRERMHANSTIQEQEAYEHLIIINLLYKLKLILFIKLAIKKKMLS